ncbi:MAG: uncharacterized protein A8A55_0409 [Amphiamblys sp. WSBS2006]|nr:MAG: uncharacterized protein A8A55_0409 [Amphiamblys sp. WSBS2006]
MKGVVGTFCFLAAGLVSGHKKELREDTDGISSDLQNERLRSFDSFKSELDGTGYSMSDFGDGRFVFSDEEENGHDDFLGEFEDIETSEEMKKTEKDSAEILDADEGAFMEEMSLIGEFAPEEDDRAMSGVEEKMEKMFLGGRCGMGCRKTCPRGKCGCFPKHCRRPYVCMFGRKVYVMGKCSKIYIRKAACKTGYKVFGNKVIIFVKREEVVVFGARNRVEICGKCLKVRLYGVREEITVRGAFNSVSVSGCHNKVTEYGYKNKIDFEKKSFEGTVTSHGCSGWICLSGKKQTASVKGERKNMISNGAENTIYTEGKNHAILVNAEANKVVLKNPDDTRMLVTKNGEGSKAYYQTENRCGVFGGKIEIAADNVKVSADVPIFAEIRAFANDNHVYLKGKRSGASVAGRNNKVVFEESKGELLVKTAGEDNRLYLLKGCNKAEVYGSSNKITFGRGRNLIFVGRKGKENTIYVEGVGSKVTLQGCRNTLKLPKCNVVRDEGYQNNVTKY